MGYGEKSCLETTLRFVDRKSTRLNSSHLGISYAVFCLKKKTKNPRADGFCCATLQVWMGGVTIHAAPVGDRVQRSFLDAGCDFFFLRIGRPPRSPLFPYTPLFR